MTKYLAVYFLFLTLLVLINAETKVEEKKPAKRGALGFGYGGLGYGGLGYGGYGHGLYGGYYPSISYTSYPVYSRLHYGLGHGYGGYYPSGYHGYGGYGGFYGGYGW